MVHSEKITTQYRTLKEEAPGCILLMQVGAFMQVMNEDARTLSGITGLKLKMAGDVDAPVVLGGFPKSGLDAYVGALVRAGHSVAIAVQDEEMGRSVAEVIRVAGKSGSPEARPPVGKMEGETLASLNPEPVGITSPSVIARVGRKMRTTLRHGHYAGVGDFIAVRGAQVRGCHGRHGGRDAGQGHELHFERLAAGMNMNDRANVAGLQPFGGKVMRQNHAVMFLDHVNFLKRVRRDQPRRQRSELDHPYGSDCGPASTRCFQRTVDNIARSVGTFQRFRNGASLAMPLQRLGQHRPFFLRKPESREERRFPRSVRMGRVQQVVDNLALIDNGAMRMGQLHGTEYGWRGQERQVQGKQDEGGMR